MKRKKKEKKKANRKLKHKKERRKKKEEKTKVRKKEKLKEKRDVEEVKFVSYELSVSKLLDKADFKKVIEEKKRIILKPNLTLCKAFPTTTDVKFVEEIIKYIRKHNKKAEIIIAEGSGGCATEKCLKGLGYEELSEKYNITLIDLNEAETKKIKDKRFKKFSFIEYPKILLTGFLISLPVLKEHTTAKVTISLKNMLGAFPARLYGGNWKVAMHKWPIEYSIHDILVCKFPDYAICDASIAQFENEVSGYAKELNILLAGNPLEVDKRGAFLLGHDWKRVAHLVLADELKNKK